MAERLLQALPIHLEEHIIGLLPPNEIACNVRLVNKAAAAHYCGPESITVRLTQPFPHHAFAHRCEDNSRAWIRRMSCKRRIKLLCLTAAHGDLSNLEVAIRATGCLPTGDVMNAAAAGGHAHVCQCLRQRGYPWGRPLASAAQAGRREACEWLLANDCPDSRYGGAIAAASGGHLGLMEWLQRKQEEAEAHLGGRPRDPDFQLLSAVAQGCDLAALQRTYTDEWSAWQQRVRRAEEGQGAQLQPQAQAQAPPPPPQPDANEDFYPEKEDLLTTACGSPTPDWREKVLWLETQGCPRTALASRGAASLPDAADRLRWLRQRGYPLDWSMVHTAAGRGDMAALEYLLGEVGADALEVMDAGALAPISRAVDNGPVAALRFVHAHGFLDEPLNCLTVAAREGRLTTVSWLVDTFGLTLADLQEHVLWRAAGSDSVELLDWLVERGCDIRALPELRRGRSLLWEMTAREGCEVMMERLVELGCRLPEDGGPYLEAIRNGDLAALRCLRRLGCPWGSDCLISRALREMWPCTPLPVLRWLVEAGCPVNWAEALQAARGPSRGFLEPDVKAEVVAWLAGQLVRSKRG